MRIVLERLQDTELCFKLSKCQFHSQEITFLGYVIESNGVKMDPGKVKAITS